MLPLLHDKCWCFVSIISILAHDGLSHNYHCAHFPEYTSEKLSALPKYSVEPKLSVCFWSSCYTWYSELQGWGLRLRSPRFVWFCLGFWARVTYDPGGPQIPDFHCSTFQELRLQQWFLWMHIYRAELSSSSFHCLLSIFFALTYTMTS